MEEKNYPNQFDDELKRIKGIEITINEPLRNHTTFRIGGPADYFVSTSDVQIIKNVVLLAKQYNVPYFILGNGSDLLFSDAGYQGVIIKMTESKDDVQFIEKDHKVYVLVRLESFFLSLQ